MSKDIEKFSRLHELKERRDAFGHRVRLLWNEADNSVHLDIDGLDLEVPGNEANEAFDHTYSLIHQRLGETALQEFTTPAVTPSVQAA